MTPVTQLLEASSIGDRQAAAGVRRTSQTRIREDGERTAGKQCAQALGVSDRTADTWWSFARAWLAIDLRKF